jgi:hypothetical protein
MVSALRRQVGSLHVRGQFYVSRVVELGGGWHILPTDAARSQGDTNCFVLCRPRKEEMAAVTRRAADTSPSSAARTAHAQSRRIKLSNDSQ